MQSPFISMSNHGEIIPEPQVHRYIEDWLMHNNGCPWNEDTCGWELGEGAFTVGDAA